jgi:hypothetical protein
MERKLLHTTITTRITLPNLRRFGFQGANAYLEALLPWITMPLLERLRVYSINEPTYSIPHLQQLMGTTGNLRLKYARFTFYDDHVGMIVYPNKEAKMYTLDISLFGRHFDWQVDSIAQVCRMLRTVLFEVEHLVLDYERHTMYLYCGALSPTEHTGANFLGRLTMRRRFTCDFGLSINSLVPYNLAKKNHPRNCYPSYRSLLTWRWQVLALRALYSLDLSMLARRQAGP